MLAALPKSLPRGVNERFVDMMVTAMYELSVCDILGCGFSLGRAYGLALAEMDMDSFSRAMKLVSAGRALAYVAQSKERHGS